MRDDNGIISLIDLPSLTGFARALTLDRTLAEDLVQETLLRLHSNPSRLSGIRNPTAYARRMVVNEFISWRRKDRRVVLSASVPESAIVDQASAFEDRQALLQDLATLPPKQRAVLVLRYFSGLNDEEIAAELGCRPGTVRSHASRALGALRIIKTEIETERVAKRG